MTWGSNLRDAARRAYLGVSRAWITKAPEDKEKMQELTIRDRYGDQATNVEHWQAHGFSIVPLPPDKEGQAEALIHYLGGSADHPVVISVADRRHRPTKKKPGDVMMFDHRKQITTMHEKGTTHDTPMTRTFNVIDKEGKVLSSIVQHEGGKKITMTNADKSTIEMDGKDIHHKPASGGKNILHGDTHAMGSLTSDKTISGLGGLFSGGLPVKT